VPGGPSDTVGRAIGSKMQEYLGQPAIVENRPGANGAIAAEFVAKSDPDGYTLLVGSIGVFSINAALFKDLRYHPVRDFAPITLAVTTPNVLVTARLPAKTGKELLDQMKNPGGLVRSSGQMSDHLTFELFAQMTGTSGIHVPYKGGAAVVTDLLGGQVDASFQNLGTVATQLKAGKIRALAVTAKTRAAQLPDVPTMAEAGFSDLVVTSWQAAGAPAKTPRDVVLRLNDAAVKALRSPEIRERLNGIGFDVIASTPEEFGQFAEGRGRPLDRGREARTSSRTDGRAARHPGAVGVRASEPLRRGTPHELDQRLRLLEHPGSVPSPGSRDRRRRRCGRRARARGLGRGRSGAPQAASVRLRMSPRRGLRSSDASARQARAKHPASTPASAAFRASTIAAFAAANSGGNIRPIAASSTPCIPSARTFSAIARNGARAGSGNAATTSARINRSKRAPCRIASSAATNAPKPFPNTVVPGPRSSAVMTAAT
jgi:tripartite-type tricarboxylate transporter receptor subunit TctC